MLRLLKYSIIALFLSVNSIFSQQKVELIKFADLENLIKTDKNSVYIVNFWATWCGPCVAELPDYQRFYEKNTHKKVKLILVSLDFTNEIEKVNKFIAKKAIKPKVYLMNDTDQNTFINKVSEKWEGTIPATWFVNTKTNKKLLIEKQINEIEINKYLKEVF
jgi:thiol-disulfide isomerase/thioredoxin